MHRHSYKGKKLQREGGARKALTRGLMKDLVEHGYITTSKPKAVAIRSDFEKLVTTAKKGTLASRRKVIAKLDSVSSAHKLVDEVAPAFKDRNGGYTRLENAGVRRGDNTPLVRLSLVEGSAVPTKQAKPAVKKPVSKPKVTTKTTKTATKKEAK